MDSEHDNDPGVCQAGQSNQVFVWEGCQAPTAGYVFFPDGTAVDLASGQIGILGECRWLCTAHLDFAVETLEHTVMELA